MLLAFGSVVAMGLPIITALTGVGVGYGVVALISHLLIDPELRPGADGHDRARRRHRLRPVRRHPLPPGPRREPCPRGTRSIRAMSTAGRAVLFAGTTVIISLLGLFLIGQQYLDGLAVGTIARRAGRDGRPRSPCCRRCSASPAGPSTGSTCPACCRRLLPAAGGASGGGGAGRCSAARCVCGSVAMVDPDRSCAPAVLHAPGLHGLRATTRPPSPPGRLTT